MTKEVLVKIKGLQLGTKEDFLTVSVPGIYHLTNGKHYIQYEERPDKNVVMKSLLKISPDSVMLTRKSNQYSGHSQMFFEQNETTRTDYPTPYGSLTLDIKTNKIQIIETSDTIEMILEYSLHSNNSHLSDNVLSIIVEAVKSKIDE